MKAQILKPGLSAIVGLLLTIPATYFLFINILNEMGQPGLYNSAAPLFERLGGDEPMGWNINLLIVGGPLIALLLNVTSVLRFDWHLDKTMVEINLQIERRWTNWVIIGLGGLCMLVLFIYLAGENCR
ncbi:MAG TPA: hypothetical protein VFZ47_10460 [Chitinophagaceae bacterium]